MNITDQIANRGMPRGVGPKQHAMLDYGVAATFFALGARCMKTNRAASTLAFVIVTSCRLLPDFATSTRA